MSRRSKLSLVFLLVLVVSSFFSAFFESPTAMAESSLQSPSFGHFFGTDILGRSLFYRVLEGTRVSLGIGLAATLGTFVMALVISFLAFKAPSWLDQLLMRLVEVLMALPGIVLISLVLLFLSQINFGSQAWVKILNVSLALILTGWFTLARQLRTLMESEKNKLYIEAARALGASESRVFLRYLLPNLSTPILVLLGLQIPNLLLFESFLSFVGLGIQPPTASWGILIQEGWRTLSTYPHLILIPSSVLFLTVLSFNILFDEIRRAVLPGLRD